MTKKREKFHVSGRNTLARTLASVSSGAAALLRICAGRPTRLAEAGLSTGAAPARRGSFLIMVVGTLALLSVIVVVYVSVGSQDRRIAAVAARTDRLNAVIGTPTGYGPDGYTLPPNSFAAYVRDIVVADLFTYVPDQDMTADQNKPRYVGTFRREMWDYPSTSYFADSTKKDVNPTTSPRLAEFFSPVGVGTDPWLASTRPEDLGWGGSPTPVKGVDGKGGGKDAASWKRRVDWPHISNIAPDGRFVNLANLRNNFSAESGFGTFNSFGRTLPRTSANLTLQQAGGFNGVQDADSGDFVAPGSPAFKVDGAAGNIGRRLDTGRLINDVQGAPNKAERHPAIWDSRQMGAFRPVDGVYYGTAAKFKFGADAKGVALPSYQWADADGDGMLDSRWQEAVDARASNSNPISAILTDEKYRFFFATRIVDLSSLINVNTASDLYRPAGATFAPWDTTGSQVKLNPTDTETKDTKFPMGATYPLGSTPADINLARMLSMEDLRTIYAKLNGGNAEEKIGYSKLRQPDAGSGADRGDYSKYVDTAKYSDATPQAKDLTATLVGKAGYLALRETLTLGTVPAVVPPRDTPTNAESFVDSNGKMVQAKVDDRTFFADASDRAKFYYERAGELGTGLFAIEDKDGSSVGSSAKILFSDPLTIESGIELLSFRGVNNPRETTRLEAALAGRYRPAVDKETMAYFSPLRSSRSETLERDGRDAFGEGKRPVGDGVLDDTAAVWNIADVRQHLTTINGSRPLWASAATDTQTADSPIFLIKNDRLAPLSATLDVKHGLEAALRDPRELFKGVVASLAPYLGEKWAWEGSQAQGTDFTFTSPQGRTLFGNDIKFDNGRTAFYGWRGAETSVLLSAMFTVNASTAMFEPRPLTEDERSAISQAYHTGSAGAGLKAVPAVMPLAMTVAFDKTYRDNKLMSATIGDEVGKKFSWWIDEKDKDTGSSRPDSKTAAVTGYTWDANSGRLDLDDPSIVPAGAKSRMYDQSVQGSSGGGATKLRAKAINVYGVTPQPFITGVMSMTAFTDAPPNAGGDIDARRVPPGDEFPELPPITIDGTIADANPDFLFRIVAFQVTNPFDQPITLGVSPEPKSGTSSKKISEIEALAKGFDTVPKVTAGVADTSNYYVRLRGHGKFGTSTDNSFDNISRFMLVGLKDPKMSGDANDPANFALASESGGSWGASDNDRDATVEPITLQPGETAVCFATSQSPRRIMQRIQKCIDAAPRAGTGTANSSGAKVFSMGQFAKMVKARFSEKSTSATAPKGVTKVYWVPQVDDDGKMLMDAQNAAKPVAQPMLFKVDDIQNKSSADLARLQADPTQRVTTVELWRALTTGSERNDRKNILDNDQLVDRMRIGPASGDEGWQDGSLELTDNLDRRLAPGNGQGKGQKIEGTEAALPINGQDPLDDKGFAITLWSQVLRPGNDKQVIDAGDTKGLLRPGQLPGYCIEPRGPVTELLTQPRRDRWNIGKSDKRDTIRGNEFVGYSSATATRTDFIEGEDPKSGAGPTLDEWWNTQMTEREKLTDELMFRAPDGRKLAETERVPQSVVLDNKEYQDLVRNFRLPVFNAGNLLAMNTEAATATKEATPARLRVADLLQNLAVAPYSDPLLLDAAEGLVKADLETWIPSSGTKKGDQKEFERATLSELLAMQFGYYVKDGDTATKDPTVLGLLVAPEERKTEERAEFGSLIVDQGRFFLDRYTPFLDGVINNTGANRKFEPANDLRVGLGVPLALNLMDAFEPLPERMWSSTKPIRGRININTATVDVLRTLPMLAPNNKKGKTWNQLNDEEASQGWPRAESGKEPSLNDQTDIAAMIVAYRDKRPESFRFQVAENAPNLLWADFGDLNGKNRVDPSSFGAAPGTTGDLVAQALANTANNLLGRNTLNQIDGVREDLGFRSIGELMCVRELQPLDPSKTKKPERGVGQRSLDKSAPKAGSASNMDYLGFNLDGTTPVNDSLIDLLPGFTSLRMDLTKTAASDQVKRDASFTGKDGKIEDVVHTDRVDNDYGERLAVMSAISNLVTVRSDLYVCWFVVAGFQKSDCVGLSDQDPLVPSIKRRFMMVIDRSNVIRPTDVPRVLVWKELPL